MATVLYRIGRYAYRSRRLVGLAWLGVLLLVGVGAAVLGGPASSSLSIPGTESQQAFDLLEERFPDASASGASARVAFGAPEGRTITESQYAEIIEHVLDQIATGPQVARIGNPLETGLISPDGRVALAPVVYSVDPTLLDQEARDVLTAAVESGRAAGMTVEVGGTATEDVPEIGAELLGAAVAVLVLVLTFGSLVAAGLPLITGIFGVVVSLLAISAAMGVVDVSSVTPLLAVMLGLAVGIDYSLFILSRYRHELLAGSTGEEAAGRAIGTAGTAVVFAGLTVVIALVGLSVNGISMLTEMGIAAAFTVLVAMSVALTLLPAILGFLGRRVLSLRLPWLRVPDPGTETGGPTVSRRWVRLVARRPVAALVVAAVLTGALAIPVHELRLGFADEGTWAEDTTQRKAYDLISEGFGAGFNGQLLVVVDAQQADDPDAAVAEVATALAATSGVQSVFPPQMDGPGTTGVLTVVPVEGPSAEITERLVDAIRTDVAAVGEAAGATVVATGSTALQIDVAERSREAVVPYLLILVGLSLVLLLLVFRSLLVPVKAAVGFLLTVAASYGTLVGVFQWGWLERLGIEATGQTMALLPLVIVGIAFGLAMDYEFFLVTRMREAWVHTGDARAAVEAGFAHSARVVAAAAMIMVAVFGAFGLLNDAIEIAQLGLALAVAIAVDAFVVRMTIVPAVLALLGTRAWWLPRWLDRLLPDVDVEGARLTRHLAERPAEPGTTAVATEPGTAGPGTIGA